MAHPPQWPGKTSFASCKSSQAIAAAPLLRSLLVLPDSVQSFPFISLPSFLKGFSPGGQSLGSKFCSNLPYPGNTLLLFKWGSAYEIVYVQLLIRLIFQGGDPRSSWKTQVFMLQAHRQSDDVNALWCQLNIAERNWSLSEVLYKQLPPFQC